MEQKMPWKRLRSFLLIVVLTVLVSVLFLYQNGFQPDIAVAYLAIDAVFLAVFLYLLESGRIHQKLGASKSTHFGSIADCYAILSILTIGCSFIPQFTCPAAAFALFCSLSANVEVAIACCTFLCTMLCLATGQNFFELAAYVILIPIGAQMAETIHKRQYRIWGCMILASVSLCIPAMFSYLASMDGQLRLFLWNGAFSIAAIVLYGMLADKLYGQKDNDADDALMRIIQEQYPMVLDIRNYSKTEYVRAVKVAAISGKCAAEIGANKRLAAAAGFYYRLGVLEGEPFIENGVHLAKEGCFPEPVIQILAEYNGEQQLPSSRESAIIHMVDACLKELETLRSQDLSTNWSQDMVIYQTINELSASGIYDESGLSMNQFLKVRELLVREEL